MAADTDSAPSASRIKGVAFREFLGWYGREYGPDRLRRLIGNLPPAQARFFDPGTEYLGILAATWYPASVVHGLLDQMSAGLSGSAKEKLAQAGARAVMGATLKGIYARLMAMFVTPQIYARFADRLWASYYDSGVFSVALVDPTTADCTIREWTAHHELMCLMNAEAASAIYEAMGQQRVRTERRECIAHGGGQCRFITTWAAKRSG